MLAIRPNAQPERNETGRRQPPMPLYDYACQKCEHTFEALVFEDEASVECPECHGDHAQGTRKRPSLRTARIQSVATEGDVHWFLVNGNVRRGMPSWSRLPDQQ